MSLVNEWVPIYRTVDDHIDNFENIDVLLKEHRDKL